jgi:tetratricopeptide (TPR) repeat protein
VYRIIRLLLLFLLPLAGAFAQEVIDDALLRRGIEFLRGEEYEFAADDFQKVLEDETLSPFHSDALYWLVKTQIALENYGAAVESADRFLVFYPGHEKEGEILYHRARLLFLEDEPEKAIVALHGFIESYPSSPFASSALYWVGESLIVLGRLEEADAVFAELLENHPSSIKREAARYRREEIALLFREKELLDLLKWSHEEYLRDAEDYYRRETEYRDAISSYRERMGDGSQADLATAYRSRLLDAKERLLILQKYYADQLLGLTDVR